MRQLKTAATSKTMLIKGNINKVENRSNRPVWMLLVGIFVLILGIVGYPLLPKNKTAKNLPPIRIVCDMEQAKGEYFNVEGTQIRGANLQSDEHSLSGRFSMKLDGKNQFGASVEITEPPVATTYIAEIWKYSPKPSALNLVATGKEGDDFYLLSNQVVEKRDNGWQKIQLMFRTPEGKELSHLSIYAWLQDKNQTVYLDDLYIETLKNTRVNDSLPVDQISLIIEAPEYRKIKEKRRKAMQVGILVSEDDDWVKGKLTDDNSDNEMDIKMRLKGDWLDHLRGNKWSFRIKTEKEKSFHRLKTFSIQHPATRSYLYEWAYHRFLQYEDVLTPRYDFLKVNINGQPAGIYAIEEHFEKQLPEYNKRREGPILKFSEEAYWQLILQRNRLNAEIIQDHNANALNSGVIRAFGEKKLLSDSTFLDIYAEAIEKLYAYKNGTKPIEDIFDIEKTARYFAIMDLFNAHHGLTWHNSRFYYNPVIRKLEPVGFDGFGEQSGDYVRPFLAYHYNVTERSEVEPYKQFFADPAFMDAYTKALLRYTDEHFVTTFLLKIKKDLDTRSELLLSEFVDAKTNVDYIVERARKIRLHLLPLAEESLRAHWNKKDGRLYVRNAHPVGLRVVGYGFGKENDVMIDPVYLPMQSRNDIPDFQFISTQKPPKKVYYTIAGIDSLYSTPVLTTPIPFFNKNKQTKTAKLPDFIIQEEKILRIPSGEFTINDLVEIPADRTLWIDAGAKILLEKGGGILSYSAVQLRGTADEPIVIEAKSSENYGFVVLQPDAPCSVSYTHFEGLNALQSGSWNMTGAVTFYEADVMMNGVVVSNNHCEDAVNLIRSKIDIKSLKINNALRDALDGDFCTGKIEFIDILKPGNDGLDFSGSELTVVNCVVKNAGDKGISIGEESTISIQNANIDGAVNALASKDLSNAYVKKIDIKNCTRAFAAYQKKPEYGGAKIKVASYTAEGVKYLHTIEKGSTLDLKGQMIEGN